MTMQRSITAFSFALLASLASGIFLVVQAQQNPGFINIDCGAPNQYIEELVNIKYETDEGFIDSGENMQVSLEVISTYYQQYSKNLRSFPNGTRNCYTLRPDRGKNITYLIRAVFWYGNYDGKNQPPSFDLYIDVNYWTTVWFSTYYCEEIMYVSQADDIQVCLVNTGNGVPFISALELRPLDGDSYRLGFGFLKLHWRYDIGLSSNSSIRYPDDVYDRIWQGENYNIWNKLNATSAIDLFVNNNAYKVPGKVLWTAKRSMNASSPMKLQFPSITTNKWIVYFHFMEIERLTSGQQREFTISMNDNQFTETVILEYLRPIVIVSTPVSGWNSTFSIESTNKSGYPPILNAVEFYTIGDLPNVPTAQDDVEAINDIKAKYHIKRESWQGDPCVPSNYTWDGLTCRYENPPRIIWMKLSSSNLTGEIVSSLSHLSTMEYFLTGNANLCQADPCPQKKKPKKILVLVVTPVSGFLIVLFGALAIVWLIKQKRIAGEMSPGNAWKDQLKQDDASECTLFSFSSLLLATNNFNAANKLGQGGFGPVYKGMLNDGKEIAVKRLSSSSGQGMEEFKNEIVLISKLQHRNLVRLMGFCIEGEEKILVYEYLSNKSLDSFLFDSKRKAKLNWDTRFRIIQGIASGLLYLHRDSYLRVIHRDLKASNILLDEKMNPKISDFGLARIFEGTQALLNTHKVVGTLGYMSPEYAMGGIFSEKSDVYSFGVLLLEIVTGKKNTSLYYRGQHFNLLSYAWQLWSEDRGLDLRDEDIVNTSMPLEAMRCIQVGLLCVQDHTTDRPNMLSIVLMLSGESDLPRPRPPTFTFQSGIPGHDNEVRGESIFSMNTITNSMVEGR
ncbi:hypothetical protein BT93_B1259 [Corymbia citriodora subsp. variegata]|nr:hypothetical protein BT93_B1259 [Corymbia citriodora subsp. variegata]